MAKALVLFVLTLSSILLLYVQTVSSTVTIGGGASTQESTKTNAVGIQIENLSRFDKLIGNCSAGEFIFGVDNEGNKFCGVDQIGTGGSGGNTTEQIQDAVGSGFTGNLSYDDAGDKFDIDSTNILSWLDNIYLRISNLISLVGNWSLDKPNYYNTTNILDFGYYNSTTLPESGVSLPTLINLTSGTYNGAITNGTKTGYDAANSICNTQFLGSHFCDEFEVTQGFSNNASSTINNSDAWIIAGSPKYIPATVPVNDCQGWTYSGTTTALGNYWHFLNATGGEGRAINCGTTLKLACCSY